MACSQSAMILKLQALLPCLLLLMQFTSTLMASEDLLWVDCPTEANYTANSTFQANLNLVLPFLPYAAAPIGFFNDTAGQPPDEVFELALCRGDVSPAECNNCLFTAVDEIVQKCPHGKSSTIWFDNCLLRYSNQSFFSPDGTSIVFYESNTENVSDPATFNTLLGGLMDSLTQGAAYHSTKMFATGFVNYTSFSKLYGLVQCTRDLSPETCYQCLADEVAEIPSCCEGSRGGRVYGANCYIRYELYPFYNLTADQSAQPPSTATNGTGSSSENGGGRGKSHKIQIIAGILVCLTTIGVVSLFAAFIYTRKKRKAPIKTISTDGEESVEITDFVIYNARTLKSATNNFSDSNKLGEGGFGQVYKGTLQGGKHIAVKRLTKNSGGGLADMKNEIVLVAKLQHKNLVGLLGCCIEEEKLLVFEYLPNGSLDKLLFDPLKRDQLDWGRRFKIIEGIARGLLYLHEDSRLRVIHRDLKASNVLLDEQMSPKISDFGLAKLFGVDETQNTSKIAGTFGYMAPEYAMHGVFSTKSDVYSFGILILEIVTGQKNNSQDMFGDYVDLLSYVWHHWSLGMAMVAIDKSLIDRCQQQEVIRCMQIGLICAQEDPAERPSMHCVILMLSSSSVSLPNPTKPSFLIRKSSFVEAEFLQLQVSVSPPRIEESPSSAKKSPEISETES